jgi:hypothetical protein
MFVGVVVDVIGCQNNMFVIDFDKIKWFLYSTKYDSRCLMSF